MNASLVINFSSAQSAAPEDPYWLTIKLEEFDDKATVEDVAAVVDDLYAIDPCLESSEPPPTDPTEADLVAAMQVKADLDQCALLLSGDYETTLTIIRSHPAEPYKLSLSVGEVTKTVQVEEEVTVTLVVDTASFLVLPSPVVGGLKASWLGTVHSTDGAVSAPTISALHNTLFWPGNVTGTIRASYRTVYDLVTAAIPGKLDFPEDPRGEEQDSNVLVFYHYQTYMETITPPPKDESITEAILAQLCGWGNVVPPEEEDPPIPEPPLPEDPCLWYGENWNSSYDLHYLADPDYYLEKCCANPTHALSPCEILITGHVTEKGLPQEQIDYFNSLTTWNAGGFEHNVGAVEFIAVGPDPESPDGCGETIRKQIVQAKSCCDEAIPMEWDRATSLEIMADNSQGIIAVTGGLGPYQFRALSAGIYFMVNGYQVQTLDSDYPVVEVYSSNICGIVKVQVTDQCSTVVGYIRATTGRWVLDRLFSPSCEARDNGLLAQLGLFPCGNTGNPISVGVISILRDGYWLGPALHSPGTLLEYYFQRISYVCGMYASIDADDSLFFPFTFSDGHREDILFLKSFGSGCCVGMTCPPNHKFYWYATQLAAFKWVC